MTDMVKVVLAEKPMKVSLTDTPSIVSFVNSDGYLASIRTDRIDAVTYDPERDDGIQTWIYLSGSDEPIAVEDSYEKVCEAIWGIRVPKESGTVGV